jgi:hypothetical protein
MPILYSVDYHIVGEAGGAWGVRFRILVVRFVVQPMQSIGQILPYREQVRLAIPKFLILSNHMADSFINTNALAGAPFARDIQGSRLLRRRWLYHLLFWLAYFGLELVLYASLRDTITPENCLLYLVLLVFQALFAYVNIYLLIPRLLFVRKYGFYGLTLLLDVLACAVVVVLIGKVYSDMDPIHHGKMQYRFRKSI